MRKYILSGITLATLLGSIGLNAAEGDKAAPTMFECFTIKKGDVGSRTECYESGKFPTDKMSEKKKICFFDDMADGSKAFECADAK